MCQSGRPQPRQKVKHSASGTDEVRVLVVEDDPVSAKLIDTALRSEGVSADLVACGEDAVESARLVVSHEVV